VFNLKKTIKYEELQTKDLSDIKITAMMDFIAIESIIDQIIPKCVVPNQHGIPETNYVYLEIFKRIFVVQEMTNIEIPEKLENFDYIEFANWSNRIWDTIKKTIKNYNLFDELFNKSVEQEINRLTKIEYKLMDLIDSVTNKVNTLDVKEILKQIDPKIINQVQNFIKNQPILDESVKSIINKPGEN
jgi:hypothetical protein